MGRVVADGVVDPETNSLTYESQLPVDQGSVRDALNDFIAMCEGAGSDCALSMPPFGVSSGLKQRIDELFEELFLDPIDYFGTEISVDSFNVFL